MKKHRILRFWDVLHLMAGLIVPLIFLFVLPDALFSILGWGLFLSFAMAFSYGAVMLYGKFFREVILEHGQITECYFTRKTKTMAWESVAEVGEDALGCGFIYFSEVPLTLEDRTNLFKKYCRSDRVIVCKKTAETEQYKNELLRHISSTEADFNRSICFRYECSRYVRMYLTGAFAMLIAVIAMIMLLLLLGETTWENMLFMAFICFISCCEIRDKKPFGVKIDFSTEGIKIKSLSRQWKTYEWKDINYCTVSANIQGKEIYICFSNDIKYGLFPMHFAGNHTSVTVDCAFYKEKNTVVIPYSRCIIDWIADNTNITICTKAYNNY